LQKWDALDITSGKISQTELFLRTYFSAKTGRRAGKRTLYNQLKLEFFPEVEIRTSTDATDIVSRIESMSDEMARFRKLRDHEWPYEEPSTKITDWDRSRLGLLIGALQHILCLPLLLSATYLPESKFAELISLLERFVFRYVIICNVHVGKLTDVYHKHSKLIRENPIVYKVNLLRDDLRELQNLEASESQFKELLKVLQYKEKSGNKALKYFLITVEQYSSWYNAGANGSPQCNDKTFIPEFSQIQIEHIYPRKPENPDPDLAPLTNTIGNLSFWGPRDNDRAGNKSFDKKKPIYFKSQVGLNREISNIPAWTQDEIDKRAKALIEKAVKIFSL
jgi:hypothetical protein